MKERLRSWLPLIPLLLLLAAIYWLNMQVQPLAPESNQNLRHDPDYIIDNFTATSLNNQGKVRFVMSAKKMLHYPDDDTTFLTLPQLSSMTAEYPPVRMTAETGEISSKGEDVYLRKNVVIVRPAYAVICMSCRTRILRTPTRPSAWLTRISPIMQSVWNWTTMRTW
jgi:lipopolysaccharide export system protein LptC